MGSAPTTARPRTTCSPDGRVGPSRVRRRGPTPPCGTRRASAPGPGCWDRAPAAAVGGSGSPSTGGGVTPRARMPLRGAGGQLLGASGPSPARSAAQLGSLGVEGVVARVDPTPRRQAASDLQHRSPDEPERHREQHGGVVVVDPVGRPGLGEQLVEPRPVAVGHRVAQRGQAAPDGRVRGPRPGERAADPRERPPRATRRASARSGRCRRSASRSPRAARRGRRPHRRRRRAPRRATSTRRSPPPGARRRSGRRAARPTSARRPDRPALGRAPEVEAPARGRLAERPAAAAPCTEAKCSGPLVRKCSMARSTWSASSASSCAARSSASSARLAATTAGRTSSCHRREVARSSAGWPGSRRPSVERLDVGDARRRPASRRTSSSPARRCPWFGGRP